MRAEKKYIGIISLVLLFAFASSLRAQDETEIIYPNFDFTYLKNTDNQKILTARLYTATEISVTPLPGLTVKFFANEEMTELGEAVTDDEGYARYTVDDSFVLTVDADNNWYFHAEFEGNDKMEAASGDIWLTDVNLDMVLNDGGEGNRSVSLAAYTTVDGEKVPVNDETINLYVPRMFSLLPIGEGTFSDGETTIDMPEGVPGDSVGNLTVIARFNDHWAFANVEKRAETDWGVPSSLKVAESHRALWTQIAPKWMIITLTIMLLGVWSHYLFAIISLIRLKIKSKKEDAN